MGLAQVILCYLHPGMDGHAHPYQDISKKRVNKNSRKERKKKLLIPVDGCIPVSEEQKAFFHITNAKTVHTDFLLAQNAFLKIRLQASRYSAVFITTAASGGWGSVSE